MSSEQRSTTAWIVPSATQSEKFARVNRRMDIHDYLPRTFHDGAAQASKCEWSAYVTTKLTREESGALAWVLTEEIMKDRFGRAKGLYDTWRKCALDGVNMSSQKKRVIESFVAPVFGLPSAPKDRNHLHGYLGEWIWYLLTRDNRSVRYQSTEMGSQYMKTLKVSCGFDSGKAKKILERIRESKAKLGKHVTKLSRKGSVMLRSLSERARTKLCRRMRKY